MLRNTANKANSIQSGFNGPFYSSIRCVHWIHNFDYAGTPKDRYELYNKKSEFGQDEITDKERTPHLYWGAWQGRASVSRVTHQWGFSKELKPEKVKRDFEKFAYFGKIDGLYFLAQQRENYPWLDNDADGAIGYCTDEGDTDARYEHSDYGKLYNEASPDYKQMVLRDQCHGRPVYEWQVPWGLDEAYGYQEVSTSVDVLGNEIAQNNLNFDWSVSGSAGDQGGTLLKNNLTGQQLLLCDLKNSTHTIESFHPSTVVMPCGAEKLLTSVRTRLSPTSRTDVYGTVVGLAWSGLFIASEFWPSESILGLICGCGLLALNGTSVYRTFLHTKDNLYKGAFAACRDIECNVVLGDWLYDDYDERQHVVAPFDEIGIRNSDPEASQSQLRKLIQTADEHGSGFSKSVMALTDIVKNAILPNEKDLKTSDAVSVPNWMESYRDAVNNRRLDLIAHVLNNTEGEKILMPLTAIDNISTELVTTLLSRRMTGSVHIDSSPLKFDPMYERVSVEMA